MNSSAEPSRLVRTPRVSLLATFGPGVRGVSPYADALLQELRRDQRLVIDAIDYASLYPSSLMPSATPVVGFAQPAVVHYRKPASWRRCAELAGDLLHIQYWSPVTAYYLAAIGHHAHRLGKKVIVTVHNPRPHERIALTGAFERRLIRSADHVIVHSASGQGVLQRELGLDPARVTVIPHGITLRGTGTHDTDRAGDCAATGLDPARRYLLAFGNIRKYKGTAVLVDAWSAIKNQWPDTTLIIAGRPWQGAGFLSRQVARLLGTDRDAAFVKGLAPSAKELRLDLRLRFLPQPEIDALCRVAVAGVFPYTRFSAQSGAATLAAGWGLPVIVTDVGALAELAVDERMLVAAGSVAALAAAMNHILGQPDALRLRAVQYAHCTAFAWPKVAERHADLYANLLRGSGIRPA